MQITILSGTSLRPISKKILRESAVARHVERGSILHSGADNCTGLLLIRSGVFRAYIVSDEGREVTIYRLFERDICLFSAGCIMSSIRFEINIEAEKAGEVWVIPADVYKSLMTQSAQVANYTNEIMASRFSDVMWLLEQIMWKSMDRRVAEFLLEEAAIEDTLQLKITHEVIAQHLGTHREVITRMLRYLQSEGAVRLSRGTIEIIDRRILQRLAQ